ncbi:MAG: hypothetical protein CM1200mP2_32090 [Planctomycetaceae bacterium]|nr:MAG: hypothetical protein CM1200mP2_32090 [Planctomycetaceae bacterium]
MAVRLGTQVLVWSFMSLSCSAVGGWLLSKAVPGSLRRLRMFPRFGRLGFVDERRPPRASFFPGTGGLGLARNSTTQSRTTPPATPGVRTRAIAADDDHENQGQDATNTTAMVARR